MGWTAPGLRGIAARHLGPSRAPREEVAIRPRAAALLLVAGLALLQGGCGTALNLAAPPGEPEGYRAFGPSTCVPFGGVERAVKGGSALCMGGPPGMLLFAGYIAVDGPLCLAGDLLTYPVARARMRGESWACWWGEQDRSAWPDPSPSPAAGSGEGIEPAPTPVEP